MSDKKFLSAVEEWKTSASSKTNSNYSDNLYSLLKNSANDKDITSINNINELDLNQLVEGGCPLLLKL